MAVLLQTRADLDEALRLCEHQLADMEGALLLGSPNPITATPLEVGTRVHKSLHLNRLMWLHKSMWHRESFRVLGARGARKSEKRTASFFFYVFAEIRNRRVYAYKIKIDRQGFAREPAIYDTCIVPSCF